MNELKPMMKWNEEDLRAEANKRARQYRNAQHRVDAGCFNAISQAQNYMQKYARALHCLRENGYKVSEEENEIVNLLVKRG